MLVDKLESSMTARLILARIRKLLNVEWIGQTAASIFWIVSVLTYGITTVGDWLQLLAASAWLVANIASALNNRDG